MGKKQWTRQVQKFEYHSYGAFSLGKEAMWGMMGLLATFITDAGISASTAAMIILIPKVWDAINDTLFGVILDWVKLKSGQKYLPWMRIGVGITLACMVAIFAMPMGLDNTVKATWIFIGYILFDTGFTMVDVPVFALPSALTADVTERGEILGNGRFLGMLGGMIFGILLPIIRPQLGWSVSAVVIAVVAGIAMLPLLLKAKESVNDQTSNVSSEGVGFKAMLHYLKTNKQLYIVLLTTFVLGMSGIGAVISLHVARICWGSESFGAILMMASMLPALVLGKAVPALIRKFDKLQVFIVGCLVTVVANILMCITGTILPVYLVLSVFASCGAVAYQIVGYMFISDTVEYAAYRTGTSASGISFSLLTFCNKLRGALLTSFALGLLGAIGFVSGEGAVQPEGMADTLWRLNTLVPAAGYLIAAILMGVMYKLRDKDVQTMSDYNLGKISKAEADQLLEKKYGPAADHTAQ